MTNAAPTRAKAKLRFPEFAGSRLPIVRLRDVTDESKLRNGEKLPSAPIMGVRKLDGIVPMEERLAGADASRYKVVRDNWFAYNPMRLNIGSIARWQSRNTVLVSPDYVVFECLPGGRHGTLLPDYLDHFRESQQWEAFVAEAGDGGVRVRIYYDDLAQIQLALPSVSEQEKVAGCLGSLNDLIDAEEEKLQALSRHKRGLMERLFPQLGEDLPRLRFPEFRSEPAWEKAKVGEVVDALVPPMKLTTSEYQPSGLFPIIDQSPSSVCGWTDDEDALIDGTLPVIVFGDHTCVLKFVDHPFAQGADGIKILAPRARIDARYLYHHLTSRPLVTSEYKRHFTDLKELEVSFPPIHSGEQQRVAEFLTAIDDQLSAQLAKVGALRQHKLGLQQLLFPEVEEGAE